MSSFTNPCSMRDSWTRASFAILGWASKSKPGSARDGQPFLRATLAGFDHELVLLPVDPGIHGFVSDLARVADRLHLGVDAARVAASDARCVEELLVHLEGRIFDPGDEASTLFSSGMLGRKRDLESLGL